MRTTSAQTRGGGRPKTDDTTTTTVAKYRCTPAEGKAKQILHLVRTEREKRLRCGGAYENKKPPRAHTHTRTHLSCAKFSEGGQSGGVVHHGGLHDLNSLRHHVSPVEGLAHASKALRRERTQIAQEQDGQRKKTNYIPQNWRARANDPTKSLGDMLPHCTSEPATAAKLHKYRVAAPQRAAAAAAAVPESTRTTKKTTR